MPFFITTTTLLVTTSSASAVALAVSETRKPRRFLPDLQMRMRYGVKNAAANLELLTYRLDEQYQTVQQKYLGPTKATTNLELLTRRLDEQYQLLCQKYLDPLLNRHSDAEFEIALSEHLEEREKQLNRRLILPSAVLGSAATALVFPPAAIITATSGSLMMLQIYRWAYDEWKANRELQAVHLFAAYATLAVGAGFLVAISLGELAFVFSEKLVHQVGMQSRSTLINVFGQQPQSVWALIDGVECQIPFEDVTLNMILIVSAGEVIASDGIIVKGDAAIDQRMLTGEAQPAEKSVGEPVWATTMVLSGQIYVQVNKAGNETVAAEICRILNETAEYETKVGSKAINFANKTVLPTLSLGAAAFPFIGTQGAIALLGTNHTINLSLLGPIGMLNFLNQAARNDILIKDGQVLEQLKTVDTIVFDKTGTLTLAEPSLAEIHTFGTLSADEILSLAATAETKQSHPIAVAIRNAAAARNVATEEIQHAQYEVGYGLKVMLERGVVHVGSLKYMLKEGIEIPPALTVQFDKVDQFGNSLVVVAVAETVVGALELHPTTRPEVIDVLAQLRARGLSLYVLSGDQEAPTRHLAESLGMAGYFAGVLPEGKAQLIEQLQNEGRTVCFVGDGINDALALKSADVSISLRGATTAATDTAQVILLSGTLARLPHLIEIAEQFNQNTGLTIGTVVATSILTVGSILYWQISLITSELIFVGSTLAGLGIVSLPALTGRSNKAKENDVTIEKKLYHIEKKLYHDEDENEHEYAHEYTN
jgi:Cu2+-exporting ATPase